MVERPADRHRAGHRTEVLQRAPAAATAAATAAIIIIIIIIITVDAADPAYIVCLNGVYIADTSIHDRAYGLTMIVGVGQSEDMTELVNGDPSEIYGLAPQIPAI